MQHISDFPTLLIMSVNKHFPTKLSTFEKFKWIFIRFLTSLPAVLVKQIMREAKLLISIFWKCAMNFLQFLVMLHKQVFRYIFPFLFCYASLFQLSSNTVMQSMNIALKFQLQKRTVEPPRGVSSSTLPHGIWNIKILDYHSW